MDWTSLYFKTLDLNVFILGTGEVASRRANRFLDNGANVILAGESVDESIINKGALLISTDEVDEAVNWADLVIIASGDKKLSDYVSKISENKLLNRADYPYDGNVIVPTSFEIGDIEISIFTNAKSPLMAKYLREKIQSVIDEEDILKIELQDYARLLLKKYIKDQKTRKKYLYEIFEDEIINDFIENGRIDEAKEYINNLVRDFHDT